MSDKWFHNPDCQVLDEEAFQLPAVNAHCIAGLTVTMCVQDPSFVQLCTSRWAQLRSSQWSDSSIAAALADVQGSILPAGLRDFTK